MLTATLFKFTPGPAWACVIAPNFRRQPRNRRLRRWAACSVTAGASAVVMRVLANGSCRIIHELPHFFIGRTRVLFQSIILSRRALGTAVISRTWLSHLCLSVCITFLVSGTTACDLIWKTCERLYEKSHQQK